MNLLAFLSEISTPIWVALTSAVSGLGAWIVNNRKIAASIERVRIKMIADAALGENAERAAFRATLMGEIAALRQLIKECEAEKDSLRERINRAEGQIVVLKASNEIMERWVAFFKDRSAPEPRAPAKTTHPNTVP